MKPADLSARQRRLAVLVLLAMVVSSGASWFAGSRIRSSAEAAARTAAPPASPILVPAESRVLATEVVTRGTARYGAPRQVSLSPSALKPDVGVVTQPPGAGAELTEGDVAMRASGRPVFVLVGGEPTYRDLGPGLEGTDVRQLEEALVRLGFDPGPVDGVYDSSTASAVGSWYQRAGFAPFTATADQLAGIRALEQDLLSARLDVLSASDAVGSATADLRAAVNAHADAVAVHEAAPSAIDAARAEASAADYQAAAELRARQGELDEVRRDPTSTPEQIRVAEDAVEAARIALDASRIAGEQSIRIATDARDAAVREVETAAAAVTAARAALANAEAAAALRSGPAASLGSALGSATRQAGIQVPADELVFVTSSPVRVSEVVASLGQPAAGPAFTVTDDTVALDAGLTLEEAPLVTPGMAATITEPDLGIAATAVVARVAARPGTDGADAFHVYVELTVDGAPAALVGTSVRIAIPVESTGGATLAVPVSALSLTADGASRVQRDVAGTLEFVEVSPGLSAGGYVSISVVNGRLSPGDLVVVGFETAPSSPSG